MMRIVLDTNVLVSALLSPRSASSQIIRLVLDDTLNLAISKVKRAVSFPETTISPT